MAEDNPEKKQSENRKVQIGCVRLEQHLEDLRSEIVQNIAATGIDNDLTSLMENQQTKDATPSSLTIDEINISQSVKNITGCLIQNIGCTSIINRLFKTSPELRQTSEVEDPAESNNVTQLTTEHQNDSSNELSPSVSCSSEFTDCSSNRKVKTCSSKEILKIIKDMDTEEELGPTVKDVCKVYSEKNRTNVTESLTKAITGALRLLNRRGELKRKFNFGSEHFKLRD